MPPPPPVTATGAVATEIPCFTHSIGRTPQLEQQQHDATGRSCSLDSWASSSRKFRTPREISAFDPFWLASTSTTSLDSRSSHDSRGCDSSHCTMCHSRSLGNIGKSSSFLSLGKRSSSVDPSMAFSKSASDLLSYNEGCRDEESSTDGFESMDEDGDIDEKRSRRFSSHWLRQCVRASSSQAWGSGLEGKTDKTPIPVRAQFSEVCSLLSGKAGGGRSRTESGAVVQDMKLNCKGNLLACATRGREVSVYDIPSAICDSGPAEHPAMITHRMPARVCSMSWSPADEHLLAMGDTDGVLWQMDVSSGHVLNEIDEHGGEKLWSISYNPWQSSVIAASSGKACVKLWDTSTSGSPVGTIMLPRKMPVCCVEFSAFSENLLALASADHNVYLYDVRNPSEPQNVLTGHSRPVSYVQFMSESRLVSSSIDGSALLWEGINTSSPVVARTYRDHKNEKSFSGLSVSSSNLIACGSEDGSAYAYFPAWSQRVALTGSSDGHGYLVTSVLWLDTEKLDTPVQECPPILAVADTRGNLKLHALIRRKGFQDATEA